MRVLNEVPMLNAERLRQPSFSLAAGQPIGQVISVRGSRASVGLLTAPESERAAARATVGKFLGISAGDSVLVGVITRVLIEAPALAKENGWHATADVDLVGEIKAAQFQRGVTDYPAIGDPVF
jgi:hypothetical protein